MRERGESGNGRPQAPLRLASAKPGRYPLQREVIDTYQRARVVPAVAELAHGRGLLELTTREIVKQAKMTRKTFYCLFDDKAECLHFACESALRELFEGVEAAYQGPGTWLDRLSAALGAFLKAGATDPALAELCLIHSRAIEVEGERPFFRSGIDAIAELMQGAREAGRRSRGPDYRDPPPITEEFCACGIVAVVSMQLKRGEAAGLPKLHGELVRLAATPFLDLDGTPVGGEAA